MGSVVLKSLSILLGLFFIFVGILKISCYLSKDLHRDMVSNIIKLILFHRVEIEREELFFKNVFNLLCYLIMKLNAFMAILDLFREKNT